MCRTILAPLVCALAVLVLVGGPYAIANLFHSFAGPRYTPDHAEALPSGYRVTVTFHSLTVHDTRDGFWRGDGEYDVVAYVQGVKVSLTDASVGEGFCAGWGCPPMMDADEDERFVFTTGTRVTIDLPQTHPLSVFTVGVELDGCGRSAFPEIGIARVQDGVSLVEIFRNPVLDWYHAVEDFQSFAVSWVGCNRSTYYAFGGNDVLGSINKFYEPPGYGAGQHVDVVSYGDFTLVYTITVAPLPGAVILNPNP
jgi:hypothetical protein